MRVKTVLLSILMALSSAVFASGEARDDALYWRILGERGPVGFLLGTIHSEDPRVVDFPQSLADDLASCDVFAMEMVPDLPTLGRLTDYMHYPQTGVLERQLGSERFARVMQALSAYQVPAEWKARMKPWAALMTLSVPPPQTGFFMDLSLSLRAAGGGLEVAGLETLEQQLSFLEDMPLEYQLLLLDQALADYHNVTEIHRQMVDAYLTGSLQRLEALTDEQFDQLDGPVRSYFVGEGIVARNHRMVEKALPLLSESRVFIAVGALHLPGPSGLITLLRQAGYRVEPLPNPFGTDVVAAFSESVGERSRSPAPARRR